jgi:phosphatidate cytidylyltransferase
VVSRILSTLLLWSLLLGSLWLFGPHAAVAILTVLAALTLHEFFLLAEKMGFRPFRWMSLTFSVLITAGPYYVTEYVFSGDEFPGFAPALLALAVVACCVRVLGERDATNRVESLIATLIGLLYVPFMLHFLVRLLVLYPEPTVGLATCVWVVAVSKFCDVGALLTGLAIGRHKMAPHISPKKTWEGAVGGVLISAGVGAGLAALAGDYLPDGLTPLAAALVAVPLALTTIVSDLIESAMKRRADIKDTGKVIPGIGGAFDLTDSLILTAPVAYVIFLFLA